MITKRFSTTSEEVISKANQHAHSIIPNPISDSDWKRWSDAYAEYIREHGSCHYFDKNGELHREDGPALEHESGVKCWFWHGEPVSEEDFEQYKKLKIFE